MRRAAPCSPTLTATSYDTCFSRQRYGAERYLREAGARLLAQDDYGKLWRVEFDDDEPLQMVEVVNSTAEPDGSYKTYFLRVPPRYRTAHGAVAWTFEIEKRGYAPQVQT